MAALHEEIAAQLRRLLFSLTLASCSAAPLAAGSVSAPMQVSATVVARAIMTVSSAPASIMVTDADIARGHLDVAAPIVIQVRTNSRSGYLLEASRQAFGLGSIDLAFGNTSMTLGESESWISRPYVAGGEVIAMRVRVHLDARTQPGSYPMPIALSVRPL